MTRLTAIAALILFAAPAAGAPSGNGKLAFAAGGIHVANSDGAVGRTHTVDLQCVATALVADRNADRIPGRQFGP